MKTPSESVHPDFAAPIEAFIACLKVGPMEGSRCP